MKIEFTHRHGYQTPYGIFDDYWFETSGVEWVLGILPSGRWIHIQQRGNETFAESFLVREDGEPIDWEVPGVTPKQRPSDRMTADEMRTVVVFAKQKFSEHQEANSKI